MTILIIIFLLTGLLSGFLAGLLGVGGGIIIVPTTYFVLLNLGYSVDNSMHVAIASSLGIICFTSISSIRSHISLGNVDTKIVRKWVFGIIIGSLLGSYLASNISGEILVIIFVMLAIAIAINMAFQTNPIIILKNVPSSKLLNFFISFFISFLSVLMGIGGGSFSVPTLTMFSTKIHRAVGTSAVFGFFIALPGVIIFMITGDVNENMTKYSLGYVNLAIVALVSITSVFTANIGAKISSKINKITLRRIFAIFLFFTCASLIIEHYII